MASSSSLWTPQHFAIVSSARPRRSSAAFLCKNAMNLQVLVSKCRRTRVLCMQAVNKQDFLTCSDISSSKKLATIASVVLPVQLLNPAAAHAVSTMYPDGGSAAETAFQFAYLGGLVSLLGGGIYLIVRQGLKRRELELAAKELQERARIGQASPVECYELGAIMLRKKLYPVARKYLELAIKKWEDDEQDLAQVYNALGYCYFSEKKMDMAIASYEKAVTLAPGYTVGWNNLGNAFEKRKDWRKAINAYEQTLRFNPKDNIAQTCLKIVKEKLEEDLKFTNV